ncbi:DUF4153 domain-containing protein [Anaerobacillus sp. MEB173]|uniref:DUF4153 domain-containing protein n=1 Tax=Anaerobacillus sp. MEB173 TaxID=3383345 RepID=UPI003F936D30
METIMKKSDWVFLVLCLLVGIVAEEAFFRGQIGISYLAFLAVFYCLFFWRFRTFTFTHQRFGYLILIAIWLLAAGYALYDTQLFHVLNIVVIPALVIFHLSVITSSAEKKWSEPSFFLLTIFRFLSGIRYFAFFTRQIENLVKRGNNKNQYVIWKKIMIGLIISVPLLFVILNLLISADAQFERLVSILPTLFSFNAEIMFRIVISLIFTFGFFCYMQVLMQKYSIKTTVTPMPILMDGIITVTVLLLLDLVYILFVAVQFKYFFSGTLDAGYTYAEYARRGFFELLFVTLINLTVTTFIITFTKHVQAIIKTIIRFSLTFLVLSSGVLLLSAFMRMAMYEEAYGFTFTRILVQTFMIFLMVIFAYTLIKIWLERLSLFHFYFMASLLYYTGINVVNIDQIVVDWNIDRYEETGKIDIDYLNQFSTTGIIGLINLYEKDSEIPGLEELLKQRKAERVYLKSDSFQSYNLTRNKAFEKLAALDL